MPSLIGAIMKVLLDASPGAICRACLATVIDMPEPVVGAALGRIVEHYKTVTVAQGPCSRCHTITVVVGIRSAS